MRHQGQSQPEKNSRRTALRKLATSGLMGLMLASNTGCRSGGGGGLSSRIRDCRLFNVVRRNQHPQTIVAGDPCCNGVVSGPVIATGDPCGMPVVATADPFLKVNGGGIRRLREAGLTVDLWPEASEIAQQARALNQPFFKRVATAKPYVIAKWAMSLDGRIALASGDSRWISSDRSRALVHELRGRMDAIIVGIGTALADNPSLTVRPPGPRTPVRVVIDPKAELPVTSTLATTANVRLPWHRPAVRWSRLNRQVMGRLPLKRSWSFWVLWA